MTVEERIEGCILGGAIGDAMGSAYENKEEERQDIFYPFGPPPKKIPIWQLTDDTQLTLLTVEALLEHPALPPELLAKYLVKGYQQKRLTGIGASTLKALQELAVGGHWSQVGRKGEYAAGNGAAMRIAPLAFNQSIDRTRIREITYITHQNEEAYVGALCVVLAIQLILTGAWTGKENLISMIIDQIPDTRVRDRLIEINSMTNLIAIGALGNSGYVVNSVPLALAAANQVTQIGIKNMYQTLIAIGGDTDTNASIAGQVVGALMGKQGLPQLLLDQLYAIPSYQQIELILRKIQSANKENPLGL